MESIDTRSGAPASPIISRRSVVRAGATAAWSVPLIQVVGAAPAFAACSGQTTTIAFNSASAAWADATHIRVKAEVLNSGACNTATSLTITVGLPANAVAGQQLVASGWGITISGNSLTFLANAPLAASTPLGFDVLVQVQGGSAGGSVPVGASASNASPIAWGSNHEPIALAAAPTLPAVLDITSMTIARNSNGKDVTVTATIKNTAPTAGGRSSGKLNFEVDLSLSARTLPPDVVVASGSSAGWVSGGWSAGTKTAFASNTTSLAPQNSTTVSLVLDYKDNKLQSSYLFKFKAYCADGSVDTDSKTGQG